jgi:hypothetical protein
LALWNNDLARAIGIASLAWVRTAYDLTGSCAARFTLSRTQKQTDYKAHHAQLYSFDRVVCLIASASFWFCEVRRATSKNRSLLCRNTPSQIYSKNPTAISSSRKIITLLLMLLKKQGLRKWPMMCRTLGGESLRTWEKSKFTRAL